MSRTSSLLLSLLTLGVVLASAQETSDRYYQAIRGNDLAALRSLAKTSGVNTKDGRETTPLMYAAAYGSLEAMRTLIDAGADVNAKNAFEATALLWCAGDLEKVRLLVGKGANVNARSKMGRTPVLVAAAHSGASAIVKLLIDKGADLSARDDFKSTALLLASNANDAASVALLLQKGTDVNAADLAGQTPLMYASANGNVEIMKMLLAKHADVNVAGAPVGQEVKNGPIALGSFTALLLSTAYGSPEAVKLLLDAGAKVNVQDARGMTPLMLAVASDHPDPRVVKLLLAKGADPKIKSKDGETTLEWAAKFRYPGVLEALGMDHKQAAAGAAILPAADHKSLTPREAAAKSIAILQRTSGGFFQEGGCVSCHAQNLTGMAVQAARANGIRVDEQSNSDQMKAVRLQWTAFEQPLLQRMDPPGAADTLMYSLLQLAVAGAPADRFIDPMIHNLAGEQLKEGNWHFGGVARPPIEDGDFSRTAICLRALAAYPLPGRKAEFDQRIARAAAWLKAAKPRTTEDRDMQLLGLQWVKVDYKAPLKDLLALQRPDGGWAQTPELASDAYATGQVLYTLHELGVPVTGEAYRKGVAYLLRTQLDDGTWHVASRAPKFQPYFQSGFPHNHDQWISASATAWATMALSYAASEKPLTAAR